uniref:RCC1-like domain-containing protein n=1 Tax=Chromera velia CCMP2878 TaxID=1169474 RepID=A0A0G4GFC6_9ALVE|eukprot:Cvel_4611.t1-p1 / transcript=Cvel_4611.t1 / gene=Cvel_4611 / organism=Chromera_velia_CCMP2878 / gene_product=Ultraviolet-B receptor UVR8, putative / transcript_product=Ultraviolet-B receptor UVR8, putative / location=Cvel_scaffold202:110741-113245(-) / protein_length=455 / sequence_SO=supercontig / SO=protein_coding / is_pseudo=false
MPSLSVNSTSHRVMKPIRRGKERGGDGDGNLDGTSPHPSPKPKTVSGRTRRKWSNTAPLLALALFLQLTAARGKAMGVGQGFAHSLVFTEDRSVFGFGRNEFAQLGLGTSDSPQSSPTKLESLSSGGERVVSACGGVSHSLLLTSDGVVISFGRNEHGQLGVGRVDAASSVGVWTPERIPRDAFGDPQASVVKIGCGYWHGLAVTSDGRLFAWGRNDRGQLGVGDTSARSAPAEVGGEIAQNNETVVAAAAGMAHTLVVCESGSVYSFGFNNAGQLGDGRVGWSLTSVSPVKVQLSSSAGGAVGVAAGGGHSLVVTGSGRVFSFGFSRFGQLGLGNAGLYSPNSVPSAVPFANGTFVVEAAAGAHHSLVRLSDGKVCGFGRNQMGQLGTGDTAPQMVPFCDVGTGNNDVSVLGVLGGGCSHSLVVAAEGVVMGTGDNRWYQLGVGSTGETGSNQL